MKNLELYNKSRVYAICRVLERHSNSIFSFFSNIFVSVQIRMPPVFGKRLFLENRQKYTFIQKNIEI